MRSYRTIVARLFGVALLAIGILMFSPLRAKVCENGAGKDQHDCPSYNIVLVATWKVGEAIRDPTFVTALATIAIAAFTGTLWWSTRGMLRATSSSIELARKEFELASTEFFSSHRPQMRLKHIWFVGDIWQGQPIEVTLDIVNVGNTTGIITNLNYVTLILPKIVRLPQRPPYDEPDEPGNPRTYQFRTRIALESGITCPREVCDGRRLTQNQIDEIRNDNLRLYFIGSIEYWDAAQRARQTAFCRYLTFDSYPPGPSDAGRFRKHRDPDYEYQD